MDNIAELKAWISKEFWKAAQIVRWAEDHFYRKSIHKKVGGVESSGNLPIITDSDGYINSSFIDHAAEHFLVGTDLTVTDDAVIGGTLTLDTPITTPAINFAGGYSITEGATVFNTGFFVGSTLDAIVLTIVRGAAANNMMGAGVDGDTQRRIVIQAGGTIVWGDGSATRDTNLYRGAANVLVTDDLFSAGGLTSVGASGSLATKAGTSTNDAAVGGVLYQTTTQTGNVGAGEDDLASYSVPANTLAVNGQSLRFRAWGTTANNANVKTLQVRFGTAGTNEIVARDLTINSAATWVVEGEVTRTGAATQKGSAVVVHGAALTEAQSQTGLNQTLSGAITFKVTGKATSNNDVVLEGFRVWWDDANT